MDINKELLTLQDELSKLESAVTHISKAEKLSTNVVEAAKQIQEDFARKLENVIDNYNEFMSRTAAITEDNISEVSNTLLKLADEVNQVTADYTKLSESTINLTEKIDSFNLPEHIQNYQKRSDEIKSLIADTSLNQEASNSDLKSSINKEFTNFLSKQVELDKKVESIQKTITKSIIKQEKNSDEINEKISQLEENNTKLTKLLEQQTNKIGTLRIFSITTFVLLVIFFVILMIK